ncbi:MAG: hypothetical protein Q8S73_20660 [Deltaproteobacteria bacterium]|nr:hypothetical protein [Deltaproteobacteria bacterium]
MTSLRPTIVLRRGALLQALSFLPALDFQVLLAIVPHACPTMARAWVTVERLAAELRLTNAIVDDALLRLNQHRLIHTFARRGNLLGIELGPVFVRESEAPENLPVEPPV